MLERFAEGLFDSPPENAPVTVCVTRIAAPPTNESHMSTEHPYNCHIFGLLNFVSASSSTCVRPYCTCIVIVGLNTCSQLAPYCCDGISVVLNSVGSELGPMIVLSKPEYRKKMKSWSPMCWSIRPE